MIYDPTGTATFARNLAAAAAGIFQLTSGQATVTVSGSQTGSGCDQTGTSTIGLFGRSPFTVLGRTVPFSHDFIVGLLSNPPQATNVNRSDPQWDGTGAGPGSMPTSAPQSGSIANGSNPNGLLQTTHDLRTSSGNGSDTGPGSEQTENWT